MRSQVGMKRRREAVRKQRRRKMASSKKSGGNSRFEKSVNGRRSSKHKEGPVGEFTFGCLNVVIAPRRFSL